MFVSTVGPLDAKIMLVGEAPGETEDRLGKPFVGPAGKTLDRILMEAGINRHECLIANVARERPPANKIGFYFEDAKCTLPKPQMKEWIAILKHEIETYRPNVVVALGGTALWALTGMKGIKTFRGTILESSLVPGVKVVATYHPQKVNYEWSLLFPTVMDMRKALNESDTPTLPPDNRELIVAPPRGIWEDYLTECFLKQDDWKIAIDLEASNGHTSWVGISHDQDFAMSIQLLDTQGHPVMNENDELEFWICLERILTSRIKQIYHNASYDVAQLWYTHGILCKNLWMDTLLGAHVCWPEVERNLGFLASICLNVPAWKHTSAGFTKGSYNAEDACNTRGIADVIDAELDKKKLRETYFLEMAEIEPAVFMQLNGVKIDKSIQDKLVKENTERLETIESGLSELLKKEINFKSPKQLAELLYIDLGLPQQFKRRQSKYDERKVTTDAESLQKLYRETGHPVLRLVLEHRKTSKLLDTFLNIETTSEDKVHTSYNIAGTMTGRWSSSRSIILPSGSGNLQNIPREARGMYVPPEGMKVIRADYKQAEAVVVAYLINDVRLKQLFKDSFRKSKAYCNENQLDVHKLTAMLMYGIGWDEITKELRRIGKVLRHSSNYSAGPAVVARELGIKMGEAKKQLELYHAMCPMLRAWHKNVQKQLQQNRTLVTPLGRKHIFMDRWGDSLFRSAYAFVPQSTVGDLLNMSLVDFYHAWKHTDMIMWLQLHDAMYIAVPEDDENEKWFDRMLASMLREIEIGYEKFIIDVDFAVGKSWGTLEEVDYAGG